MSVFTFVEGLSFRHPVPINSQAEKNCWCDFKAEREPFGMCVAHCRSQ